MNDEEGETRTWGAGKRCTGVGLADIGEGEIIAVCIGGSLKRIMLVFRGAVGSGFSAAFARNNFSTLEGREICNDLHHTPAFLTHSRFV